MKVWVRQVCCFNCGDILSLPITEVGEITAIGWCVNPQCKDEGKKIPFNIERKWGLIMIIMEADDYS